MFGADEFVLVNTSNDNDHLLLRAGESPARVERNLLEALGPQLGMHLPTWYFAPHARKFRWNDYLVRPGRTHA